MQDSDLEELRLRLGNYSKLCKTASQLQKSLNKGHGKAKYIIGVPDNVSEDGVEKDVMDENLAYFEAACKMLTEDSGRQVTILSKSIYKGCPEDREDREDREGLYIMTIYVVQEVEIEGH